MARAKAAKPEPAPVEVREVVKEVVRDVPVFMHEVWLVRDKGDQPPHGVFSTEDAANAYVDRASGRDGVVSSQFEVAVWPVQGED